MSDEFLTLTELALVNNENVKDLGITDLLDEAPVLARLAADSVPGTTHSYLKETLAPVVGFRTVNNGRENKKSGDTQVDVTLKLLDCSFAVDVALADQYKNGPEAYILREARRHLKAGFSHLEKCVFYGSIFDASGFAGLANDDNLNDVGDLMVYDGGGDGDGESYSLWAIRTGSDLRDMVLLSGLKGNISIGESVVQALEDPDGGRYAAYYTPIHAWAGVQVGGSRSVGRIANLTDAAGLNDDKIAELLSLFPSNRKPNLLVTNRRGVKHLRASRTATNPTGAPAPFPVEAFGIPLVETDSVLDTEDKLVTTTAGA